MIKDSFGVTPGCFIKSIFLEIHGVYLFVALARIAPAGAEKVLANA